MIYYLKESWPVIAALVFVILLTYGATMPYIRKDRKRRAALQETQDD